jgi:hypothetical protein
MPFTFHLDFFPKKEIIIPKPKKFPKEQILTKEQQKELNDMLDKKKKYWALLFFIGNSISFKLLNRFKKSYD